MSKSSLIKATAKASGFTEATVRSILDSASSVMSTDLANGDEPYGMGLGRFYTVKRPPKTARDIRRAKDVQVPARTVVLFKPSKPLTELVNGKRKTLSE